MLNLFWGNVSFIILDARDVYSVPNISIVRYHFTVHRKVNAELFRLPLQAPVHYSDRVTHKWAEVVVASCLVPNGRSELNNLLSTVTWAHYAASANRPNRHTGWCEEMPVWLMGPKLSRAYGAPVPVKPVTGHQPQTTALYSWITHTYTHLPTSSIISYMTRPQRSSLKLCICNERIWHKRARNKKHISQDD